jgi:hypothetical protein
MGLSISHIGRPVRPVSQLFFTAATMASTQARFE